MNSKLNFSLKIFFFFYSLELDDLSKVNHSKIEIAHVYTFEIFNLYQLYQINQKKLTV